MANTFRAISAAALLALAAAGGNGRGVTPPMGWRSWNFYGGNINQAKMMAQMGAMANRSRTVDGAPTSLLDLGFSDVGLDDNWQACGSYGPNGDTYHDVNGDPVINTSSFPDFKAMTDYAHSLGETAGWYGNNCICRDHCSDESCYQGDVNATIAFGFDSTKLDGCGAELDLDMWWGMFAKTGKNIMVENCHWGLTLPNATWCPWTYYRSSGDIRAEYASIVSNLNTVPPLAAQNLSTPECWAYPDMLEVGVGNLSFVESRSHFAAWCVVSSPLILGLDMTDDALMASVWPIIGNPEAIAVNQAYHGFSGSLFAQAPSTVDLCEAAEGNVESCTVPAWQSFYKPINATATAVLLMNHADTAADLSVAWADVPNLPCAAGGECNVRDLHRRANVGAYHTSYSVAAVESHDSVFLLLTMP